MSGPSNASMELLPASQVVPEMGPAIGVVPGEVKPTPEAMRENHTVVREGFLNIDNAGRRLYEEGVCGDAIVELQTQCGDPDSWTDADMGREEIHDLVMTYRTLGMLAGDRALLPEEQAVLQKLTVRQSDINTQRMQEVQNGMSLDSAAIGSKQIDALAKKQKTLLQVQNALREGIKTTEARYATSSSTVLQIWAKPGEDMDAKFTGGITRIYEIMLGQTDAERASSMISNEPVRRPMTEEEKRILLAQIELIKQERARQQARRRQSQTPAVTTPVADERLKVAA